MINIGILTSSRADYGIYLPLLKALEKDHDFSFSLIVFGTHLSKFHGFTLDHIIADGYNIAGKIESLIIGDSPNAIATSYALTSQKMSDFWEHNNTHFDFVFALGDRFEMAAAVFSGIPYGIKFIHLHGGEKTLGAIDNIYRHSISLASSIHFVSTALFKERLEQLLDSPEHIYNIGSLSIENIDNIELLTQEEFKLKWGIDLCIQTLLVTVHPETVHFEQNEHYAQEVFQSLKVLSKDFQIVITMPNADTSGIIYRDVFSELARKSSHIYVVENFGTQSYFSCMKHAALLLGNTSSGIIEAASFGKYVLNLGKRQEGRLQSGNVINLPFEAKTIIEHACKYAAAPFNGENIYYKARPSREIIEKLKMCYAQSR